MKPTWIIRLPIATSRPTMSRQSPAEVASGFSQSTGLPASSAASTSGLWVGSGEATITASTLRSPIRPAASA